MLALSRRTIPTAVLTLALGFATAGCSSDETGPQKINPAVVGTWNATSVVLGGGADPSSSRLWMGLRPWRA